MSDQLDKETVRMIRDMLSDSEDDSEEKDPICNENKRSSVILKESWNKFMILGRWVVDMTHRENGMGSSSRIRPGPYTMLSSLQITFHVNLLLYTLMRVICRSDAIFLRKNSPDMFQCFLDGLEHDNNTVENIEAVYTTIALLIVEVACDDTLSDFLNLLLRIQDLALSANNNLPQAQRYNLHAVVASLLILLPHIVTISPLKEYSEKLIEDRRSQNAFHLLPELLVHYDVRSPVPLDSLLVDKQMLAECLKAAGLDSAHVTPATMSHRSVWIKSVIMFLI
ncbi:Protein EFR3 B [Homalodisca vitripennis]|nr:Protein EFR3 B [Homalodisca vitripennis]